MKNHTPTHSDRQSLTFHRKLNHLTAVIGLANWTFVSPTAEEVNIHQNNAHVLRANAIHKAVKAVNNAIKTWAGHLYHRLRRHYRVKSMIQQLNQLEDHRLNDIGIERSSIAALANKQIQSTELAQHSMCSGSITVSHCSDKTTCAVKHTTKSCANDSYHLIDSACG